MLETRNVFIDTQYFVKSGLHFDGPAFKSFRKYCEAKELFHISTTVVEREVGSKIKASVKEALGSIQTFRRKARLLASLDDDKFKGLFEEINEDDIYKKSSDVLKEFMDGEDLLSMYFETPPLLVMVRKN